MPVPASIRIETRPHNNNKTSKARRRRPHRSVWWHAPDDARAYVEIKASRSTRQLRTFPWMDHLGQLRYACTLRGARTPQRKTELPANFQARVPRLIVTQVPRTPISVHRPRVNRRGCLQAQVTTVSIPLNAHAPRSARMSRSPKTTRHVACT